MERPKFSDLPLDKSHPPHSAWIRGPSDSLGTFNDLTPEIIQQAYSELRTGHRTCLNWDLNKPSQPAFNRKVFEHEVKELLGRCVCDDIIHFNTQSSSQWDGFRHFGYQARGAVKKGVFYNNLPEDYPTNNTAEGNKGMGEVAINGIAGRGVLLDVFGYCQAHGMEYDPWSRYEVTYELLQEVIAHQKVEIRKGDILILRIGYHVVYEAATEEQIIAKASVNPPTFAGIAQDLRIAEWLWDTGIVAVAGDAPALEAWPPNPSMEENPKSGGFMLHEIMLGGWGMSIGEMWYLERLLEICKDLGRWSFFLSSSPLNVPGGVASPPNVMALF